ncbi:hypothetical protein P148_SR1C00001G1005 [candidate division SR1 bacterium RAAC1_SR1_1]|nr:hypothetical protein P148_SR1C00001G1005 [candidate division SR1 bacterium RAAC1_SR1_1]
MKIISLMREEKIIKEDLVFHYIKSTGPGGQNVNKRNTKVQLFFNFQQSKNLSDQEKVMLQELYNDDTIIIISHEERSQKQNKESAIQKLFNEINTNLIPRKERLATKFPRSQKTKRYVDKTRQGQKKKIRNSKICLDNEE